MGFARQIADRILFFDEGMLVEEGPPDRLLDSPQELRTRDFLSSVETFWGNFA